MSNYRDAARDPAFFDGALDARAVLPLLPLMLHFSLITLMLALFASAFFAVLSLNKLTIPRLYRKVRSFVRGKIVTGRPFWMKKRRY